jgi:glycosyltransferase involved in cell wall biosynthesis
MHTDSGPPVADSEFQTRPPTDPPHPDRPLRIGMLAPGYPSGAPGDYRGIFVQLLTHRLKARGHRVCVVTSRLLPDDAPFQQVDDAEEVHRFGFWSEGRHLVEYRRIPIARTLTYLASARRQALRAFAAFGCDLVHSHFFVPMGPVGASVSRGLGLPHVLTVHGGADSQMMVRRRWMWPLGRWILRRADCVTASAHHVQRDCEALGIRFAEPGSPPADRGGAGRIELLPMGIDARFLEDAAGPPPDTPPGILSTRTLRDERYRVSDLIRAMKTVIERHPRARCTIAGDGPDRAKCEALTRELGLEKAVEFVGWADPARLAQLLRTHAIYVSASRADGASVSLFEAMACGSYPVVSDIDANTEWVREGENGRLFALGDAGALAGAILRALDDPAGMRRSIELNRATARERFSWVGIARQFERIYLDLAGRGSPGG